MTLVDTSVWIDYFNELSTPETNLLDRLILAERLLVGDLILTEVLQGFRAEAAFNRARALLSAFEFEPMVGRDIAIAAAHNRRALRARGVTVRGTIDALIATFCIEEGHDLLHRNRDFDPFERHLGLRVVRS